MKKFTAVFIAVVMMFTLLPVFSAADPGYVGDVTVNGTDVTLTLSVANTIAATGSLAIQYDPEVVTLAEPETNVVAADGIMITVPSADPTQEKVQWYDADAGHVIFEWTSTQGSIQALTQDVAVVSIQFQAKQEDVTDAFSKMALQAGDFYYMTSGAIIIGKDPEAPMDVEIAFRYPVASVASPEASLAAGEYKGVQTVALTADEGSEIYYAIDGGEEQLYIAPISIHKDTTITAYATVGTTKSETASFTYTITGSYTTKTEDVSYKGSDITGTTVDTYPTVNDVDYSETDLSNGKNTTVTITPVEEGGATLPITEQTPLTIDYVFGEAKEISEITFAGTTITDGYVILTIETEDGEDQHIVISLEDGSAQFDAANVKEIQVVVTGVEDEEGLTFETGDLQLGKTGYKATTPTDDDDDDTSGGVPSAGFKPSGSDSEGSIVILPGTSPAPTTSNSAEQFSDMSQAAWAKDAVSYLIDNGVLTGYEDGTFRPNNDITRAEFATMIVKAFKLTSEKERVNFVDVPKTAWFAEYIDICYNLGIVKGTSEVTFEPAALITREQMSAMIDRTVKLVEKQIAETGKYAGFADYEQIADYAKPHVEYLAKVGIVNGYEDGTFRPQNTTTRAEAAMVIYNTITALAD